MPLDAFASSCRAFLALAVFFCLMPVPCASAAVVYNLSADWQDNNNPFSPWSIWYTQPANNYQKVSLVAPTVRGSDPWLVPQQSYGDLPGVFRSNGTELFMHDWAPADIVAHTDFSQPIAIVWTAPAATRVSITLDLWAGRQIGRSSRAVFVIEDELDAGLFGVDPLGYGPDQAHPNHFTYTSSFILNPGSDIILGMRSDTGFGDYVAHRYTIEALDINAVPEPMTSALVLAGLLPLAWLRRRRASHASR